MMDVSVLCVQKTNRRVTVGCPKSSSALTDTAMVLPPHMSSLKRLPLLHPESPLTRRMKVSFPNGGGTGVGFSPEPVKFKRGSLEEQLCRVRVGEGSSVQIEEWHSMKRDIFELIFWASHTLLSTVCCNNLLYLVPVLRFIEINHHTNILLTMLVLMYVGVF